MITEERLSFWIEKSYNVLITGRHGVGKSTIVIDAFNKAGLKWQYFSASTMDPWVDFIGVPKEKKDGATSYLELIRPKSFQEDEVEAIFLDEFNRSPKKVRNAVMELIQFKSINGKKFNKLKVVWAAINPEEKEDDKDDLEYDVEKLDPAQKDRFHVHVELPYKPDMSYFKKKYGDNGENAVKWWHTLPEPTKNMLSPRRLDYGLKTVGDGGDIRDVFPKQANVSELQKLLTNGSVFKEMDQILKSGDSIRAKEFIGNENNWRLVSDSIQSLKPVQMQFWVKQLPQEILADSMSPKSKTSKIGKHIVKMAAEQNDQWARNLCKEVYQADTNRDAVKQIAKEFGKSSVNSAALSSWKREANGKTVSSAVKAVSAALSIEDRLEEIKKQWKSTAGATMRNLKTLDAICDIGLPATGASTDECKMIIREIARCAGNFQWQTLESALHGNYRQFSETVLALKAPEFIHDLVTEKPLIDLDQALNAKGWLTPKQLVKVKKWLVHRKPSLFRLDSGGKIIAKCEIEVPF